jgi:hypothetical protein
MTHETGITSHQATFLWITHVLLKNYAQVCAKPARRLLKHALTPEHSPLPKRSNPAGKMRRFTARPADPAFLRLARFWICFAHVCRPRRKRARHL